MSKNYNSNIDNTVGFSSIINNVRSFASTISNSKYFTGILENFTQVNTLFSNIKTNVVITTTGIMVYLNNNINLVSSTVITFSYVFIQEMFNTIITTTTNFTTGFTTLVYSNINFVQYVNLFAGLSTLYRQILNIVINTPFVATVQIKRLRWLAEWDSNTLGQMDTNTLYQTDYEIS